jgi:hypothetical protein
MHSLKSQSVTRIIFFFGLVSISATAHAAFDLVEKDKTSFSIVVPTNALPSEKYAAEELQKYLEKISGVRLPINAESDKAPYHEILIGNCSELRKIGLSGKVEGLATDGFILQTDHDRLVIAGNQPRGTLYGVYALLEEKLGVRWFTSDLEVVPHTNRISLPTLSETHVPALHYREVYWTEIMRAPDFAARHRLNGNSYQLTAKHGGRFAVYFPFVHSFDTLIPPELYKDHPEYFPLINGKRVNGYVQRCLSNPDVIKLGISTVREWIKAHPEATIFSVSQNDTGHWCQCEACKALDDREGSPAASMVQFVNTIAGDIEHDFPNIRIDTLAYQYTRKPPKTLRPRANVIVRLCSIECCFAHPLETCSSEQNRRFRGDIVTWQPIAPALYVWDYTPNFGHYQQPFPNLDSLQPNVQFFVQHGVQGLFEQGNYSSGGNGELGPLRSYLLAKLLWDPNTDMARHTREFTDAYYGQAAPNVRAYLDLLQHQVRGKDVHAHIFDSPKAAYLNQEFLDSAEKILDDALRAADDETIRARVQVALLPVWYVRLATDRVTGAAKSELLHKFLDVARRGGISNMSESKSLDDWAKSMATQ